MTTSPAPAQLSLASLLVSFAWQAGAPAAELDALIEKGRALLDEKRPALAEKVFDEAAAKDGGSPHTRMWVLRAWMDQGRSDDTLDAIDALRAGGAKGPDMDYLYGMAFARRA